jgi:phospholipase/carboxylesterase
VIVTGFSQGAMLSFALATSSSLSVSAAVPVSGRLPRSKWPEARAIGGLPPRIVALHGESDAMIPIADDRALIAHMQSIGFPAEIRTYPNTGHEITPAMQRDLLDTIATMSKELGCTPR